MAGHVGHGVGPGTRGNKEVFIPPGGLWLSDLFAVVPAAAQDHSSTVHSWSSKTSVSPNYISTVLVVNHAFRVWPRIGQFRPAQIDGGVLQRRAVTDASSCPVGNSWPRRDVLR